MILAPTIGCGTNRTLPFRGPKSCLAADPDFFVTFGVIKDAQLT